MDVHRDLAPGMLEHTYEVCLEAALQQRDCRWSGRCRFGCAIWLLPWIVGTGWTCWSKGDLHVGLLLNFNLDALAAGGWKRVLRRE
jgi:hypothetical protein